MKTQYKHIHFNNVSCLYPRRTTQTWYCYNSLGDFLGTAEWNCGWRQYWFIIENRCGFSISCLNDITDFIKQLSEEYKKKLEKRNVKNKER